MSLATASLLSSMFVSYLSDNDTPPPMWAKKVFLYYIPRALQMSSYKQYKEELYGEAAIASRHPNKHLNEKEVYKMHFMDDSGTGSDSPKSVKKFKDKDDEVKHNGHATKSETTFSANCESETVSGKKREVLVKDVREILQRLQFMKEKIQEGEENKKIKEDWKHIGRAIDRIMFWICLIVLLSYIIYACVKISYTRLYQSQ